MAHKLDLVRCYRLHEFVIAMKAFDGLVIESVKQKNDWAKLLRYVIQCVDSHGDRLLCQINADDELIAADVSYRNNFGRLSQSPRLVEALLHPSRPVFHGPPGTPVRGPAEFGLFHQKLSVEDTLCQESNADTCSKIDFYV